MFVTLMLLKVLRNSSHSHVKMSLFLLSIDEEIHIKSSHDFSIAFELWFFINSIHNLYSVEI